MRIQFFTVCAALVLGVKYADALTCADHCNSCSVEGDCDTCNTGYMVVSGDSGNYCDLCYDWYDNCATCSEFACLTCIPGWTKNADGDCGTACSTGCTTCSSATDCTECDDAKGYILNGNTACDACAEGKYADAGDNTCKDCANTNCKLCTSAAAGTCVAAAGCKAGYMFKTAESDCKACATEVHAQCLACNEITVVGAGKVASCTSCSTGYFLDGQATKSCFSCDRYASDCTECNANACTKCDATKKLLLDNFGGCQPCETGTFYDNGACTACSQDHCAACNDGTATSCTKCADGYYLDGTNTCQLCDVTDCNLCSAESKCEGCTAGFYPVADVCKVCPGDECLECAQADGKCTKCADGFYADESDGLCKVCTGANCIKCSTGQADSCLACNAGYFLDGANACAECDITNCVMCADGAGTCTQCLAGWLLNAGTTPPACEQCDDANCADCDTTAAGDCLACKPGYGLTAATGTCSACTGATFVDPGTKACAACAPGCATCSDDTSCDSCTDAEAYLNGAGECIPKPTCAAKQYVDATNMCQDCDADCATCEEAGKCVTCLDTATKYLDEGVCATIPTCGPKQYLDTTDYTCKGCDADCAICEEAGKCTACATGTLDAETGQCVSANDPSCAAKQYQDENGACQACDESCATCSEAGKCDTCAEGEPNADTFLCDDAPDGVCAHGTYENEDGDCIVCDASCETCADSATNCLTCPEGSDLQEEDNTCSSTESNEVDDVEEEVNKSTTGDATTQNEDDESSAVIMGVSVGVIVGATLML